MPGGLTLLQSLNADIPTPAAGKVTVFFSIDLNTPAYKDDAGNVFTLVGSAGTQGPAGPAGFGFDGEDAEPLFGLPGAQGNPGITGSGGPVGPMFVVEDGIDGQDGLLVPTPAPSAGNSDWTTIVTKSADQDVTNAGVTNDTELSIAVLAGEKWYFELLLFYSGNNATGDYIADFTFPTASGVANWFNITTADGAAQTTKVILIAASVSTQSLGTTATITDIRAAIFSMSLCFTANGTLQYRFGNASVGVGRTSRTNAGSILRGKKCG